VAKVIHNFGWADRVDRETVERQVASISRFLEPEQAVAAAAGTEVEILDSRRLGGAWTLDRIWERLGIGAAIRRAAAGRRIDGEQVERVIFALAAQRALEPGSKLAATGWVAERVAIENCAGFSDDAAYAAMDFLLEALTEIAAEVFASVAHLLNLDLDIIFVDTTSTYFELAGDMLSDVLIPLLDPRRPDQVGAYERALERLGEAARHVDVLVSGHGAVAEGPEVAARFAADRAYIDALRRGEEPVDARWGPRG
jgi:hypothetical protein